MELKFIACPMLDIVSQTEIKLNWLPMTPFLVYIHNAHLTFGKPFVRKQYNVLVFFIVSAKSVEVPIELSEDCYCNLSLPIPNEQTLYLIMNMMYLLAFFLLLKVGC